MIGTEAKVIRASVRFNQTRIPNVKILIRKLPTVSVIKTDELSSK